MAERPSRSRLIGLVVSALLLGVLYWTLDVRGILAALRQAHVGWLVLSVGLIVPLTMIRAVRFAWIAPPRSVGGLKEALRLTLVASAFNVFLPAKAGDLTKSFFVSRRGGISADVAIAIVVYERVADVFALATWCLIGFVWAPAVIRGDAITVWLPLTVGAVGCGALVLDGGSSHWIGRAAARAGTLLGGRMKKLAGLAAGWPALHRQLGLRRAGLALLTLALWLLQLTQVWLFAVTLSIPLSFAAGLSVAAMALAAGQLPLTFSGLGTRDVALVLLLGNIASPEAAAAMGILTATRNLLPPLAGTLVMQPYLREVADAGRRWRRGRT